MSAARRSVFPVVLAGFTAFLDLYATQPLLPLLARVFHAGAFAVSLTVTAPTVAVAIAAPFVGTLGDRLGHTRVIIAAAAALGIATALAATAGSLPSLVAWRFVQGVFTPGVFALTIAYIHEEYPADRTGRATAAYISGTVVGGFTGRATAGIVASGASWPAAFVVLAILNVVAAAALWIWLPRPRRVRSATGGSRRASLEAHLRHRQLQATYAVGFCVLFVQVAMFTYVTFQLAAPPYGLSTAALGWLFVTYLVGAVITPLAGRWIDVRGHRAALALATAIGVAGSLLTLASPLWAIVIGLALAATGVFIAQATASSHVGATAEHDRGLAVGLYATFYYAGGATGAALPAAVWDVGGWPACVALVIAVQLLAIAIALVLWRPPSRRRDEHEGWLIA